MYENEYSRIIYNIYTAAPNTLQVKPLIDLLFQAFHYYSLGCEVRREERYAFFSSLTTSLWPFLLAFRIA